MRSLLALCFLLPTALPAHAQENDAEASALRRGLAQLRQEDVLPCDTWVALHDTTASGATLLAKNSDRTVFDCQPLFLHPRRQWEAGATIDLGRTSVPQVAETYATLGSSPYWCWGYEEGINEFGVAIGNEGLFTRGRAEDVAAEMRREAPPLGPTGMDLLRLALERSRTAREAVETLGVLLEEHGQFGSGMPMQPAVLGAYDNSFLVADAGEAWIVETCGRLWAARRVETGTASISNVPSLGTRWDLGSEGLVEEAIDRGWWPAEQADRFDFAAASGDPAPLIQAQAERARTRAACSSGLLAGKHGSIDPRWMMRVARDRSTDPSLDLDVTASSCIAVLPKAEGALPVFWWCAGTPSNGCYVPFFVQGEELPAILSIAGTVGRAIMPPSKVAMDGYARESYWWRFRELCDLVRMDYAERNAIVRAAFDPLERDFEQGLEPLLARATELRAKGEDGAAATLLASYSAGCVERALTTLDELTERLRSQELVVPEAYRPYIGRYGTEIQGQAITIEVLVQNSRLAALLPDGRVFELLEPGDDGRWIFALTDQAAVSFLGGEDAPATGLRLHQQGTTLELQRLESDG